MKVPDWATRAAEKIIEGRFYDFPTNKLHATPAQQIAKIIAAEFAKSDPEWVQEFREIQDELAAFQSRVREDAAKIVGSE